MTSHSTLFWEDSEAAKALVWIVKALGISPYNPQIPERYKYVTGIYSVIMMLWFAVHYPVSIYFTLNTTDAYSYPPICMQTVCENLEPVLLISCSLYDKRNSLKAKIADLIYADQCLYSVGVEVWFGSIKRFLKVSCLLLTIYCIYLTFLCLMCYQRLTGNLWSLFSLSTSSFKLLQYDLQYLFLLLLVFSFDYFSIQALNEDIRLKTLEFFTFLWLKPSYWGLNKLNKHK